MKRIIAALFLLLIGIGVLGYPTLSNYLAEKNGSYALDTYEKAIKKQNSEQLKEEWAKAESFNANLSNNMIQDPFAEGPKTAAQNQYYAVLNVNKMMGKLEIPKIKVAMPIYHGTSEKTLSRGIGHLEGSALPIGGAGTHSVLTGHTGLTSGKLLTDLTELKNGDLFYVTVLDKILAYKVDQVKVVLPDQTEDLKPIPGEDHCTVVTCTPYGVNSHRLLVRGIRTEYIAEEKENIQPIKNSHTDQKLLLVALCTTGVMILLVGIRLILLYRGKKREEKRS